MELSYSLHLGNDKRKSIKARREAKNTPSGTVNRSNNAIQNIRQLGKVNHHNLRQYDNNQEQIKTIKGSNNIVKDVKELYLDLFEEARLEYNNKQIRDDRKIDDYFYKISDDTKHDLACEIIIELGDMAYWEDKTIEYKYEMTKVFEKENCKTGLSRQVGKTSIFTKESLVIIQDKMRERCIEEFNQVYQLDNKLKEKRKGKNRDYTAYERLKFNEKANELKKELSNLREEVSDMEVNKESINKEITKLNKDKTDIADEIDKKKKINNKIILKSKNQLWDENEKLKEENEDLKRLNYQYEHRYNDLKEKTDYLINQLNKVFQKLPEFIKTIVDRLFNHSSLDLKYFKQQYDPEVKSIFKGFNLFNKKEVEKATKNINYEMEKSAEDFYTDKKDKEKDDFEL